MPVAFSCHGIEEPGLLQLLLQTAAEYPPCCACSCSCAHVCPCRFTDTHGGEAITALAFDYHHRRLFTGSEGGSVKAWNFSSGACLKTMLSPSSHDVTGARPGPPSFVLLSAYRACKMLPYNISASCPRTCRTESLHPLRYANVHFQLGSRILSHSRSKRSVAAERGHKSEHWRAHMPATIPFASLSAAPLPGCCWCTCMFM